MAESDDKPFLTRWAQRKQAAQQAGRTEAEPKSAACDPAPLNARDGEPPIEPEAPFDPATLPHVEDLTATSDITAFLRKGVPEELKRLALRRVWALDPQIRDFIEVAENQYDWNAVNGVPGFGALPEGTDIQALLAQATGQVKQIVVAAGAPDAEAPVSPIRADLPPPQPSPNETVEHESVGRDSVLIRAAVGPSGDLRSETSQAPDVEPTSRPLRRRHGGALPA